MSVELKEYSDAVPATTDISPPQQIQDNVINQVNKNTQGCALHNNQCIVHSQQQCQYHTQQPATNNNQFATSNAQYSNQCPLHCNCQQVQAPPQTYSQLGPQPSVYQNQVSQPNTQYQPNYPQQPQPIQNQYSCTCAHGQVAKNEKQQECTCKQCSCKKIYIPVPVPMQYSYMPQVPQTRQPVPQMPVCRTTRCQLPPSCPQSSRCCHHSCHSCCNCNGVSQNNLNPAKSPQVSTK